MTRDETIETLRHYLSDYVNSITTKSLHGDGYICPLCGSGTGTKKTGGFAIFPKSDPIKWKCFSCNEQSKADKDGGDIFDLIGKVEHINDFSGQFKRACEIYHLYPDDEPTTGTTARSSTNTSKTATISKVEKAPEPPKPKTDYTEYIKDCVNHIGDTDYHRGIGEETLKKHCVGFDKNWVNPLRPNSSPTPRLIIPTGKYNYTARDTTGKSDYKYIEVGEKGIFNKKALKQAEKPIFITEGAINALSIIDVGGEAIAIGGTSGRIKLIECLKREPPKQPLILTFDHDQNGAGQKAQRQLADQLDGLRVKYILGDSLLKNPETGKEYNDTNDRLIDDKEGLRTAVLLKEQEAGRKFLEKGIPTADTVEEYQKYFRAANRIEDIFAEQTDSLKKRAIPTGFEKLDAVLDGGLYEGLYILGAISSLGKTTFCLQIADQIAKQGQDVLIFSLEMSRLELMGKSISRLTKVLSTERHVLDNNAKSYRGVIDGKRHAGYNQIERSLLWDAQTAYVEDISEHLYIVERPISGELRVEDIRAIVDKHISLTGNKPVVFVDYLQILTPSQSLRIPDKRISTDEDVTQLKGISRQYQIPIVAVSSLNRANYKQSIDLEAFKESGAIEYSSDVLLGMQLSYMYEVKQAKDGGISADEKQAIKDKKKASPREVSVEILKNRYGKLGDVINYKYIPVFNYFYEVKNS